MNVISLNGTDKNLFNAAYNTSINFITMGSSRFNKSIKSLAEDKIKYVYIVNYDKDGIDKDNIGKTIVGVNERRLFRKYKDYIDHVTINIYDSKDYSYDGIKKTLFNETYHVTKALTSLVPLKNKSKNYFVTNTSMYANTDGRILLFDNRNLKKVGSMLNDTLTKMVTLSSLVKTNPYFMDDNISVNDIFKSNNCLEVEEKEKPYIYITKLLVSAFNNNPDNDYDKMISNNKNILLSKRTCNNKEVVYNNDLLYGYISNPIHIKEVFEKYMGVNSYDSFMIELDDLYNDVKNDVELSKDKYLDIINTIIIFFIVRFENDVNTGRFTYEESYKIIKEFYKIVNQNIFYKDEGKDIFKKKYTLKNTEN